MSLGSMEERTEGMKRQAQELIEQAYQRGYKAGQESDKNIFISGILEQGRNEAWEAAMKIAGDCLIESKMTKELFDNFNYAYAVFNNFTASDAIDRIRAYEKQKKEEDKIKVDKEKVMKLADEIGIHKLFAIVKEIRGE